MKLLRQRFKSDCGVAALAMATGLTYKRALKVLHPRRKKYERYSTSILRLEAAFRKLKIPFREIKNINSFKDLKNPTIVIIRSNYRDPLLAYHALVWNPQEQAFYDPHGTAPITSGWRISKISGKQKYTPETYYKRHFFLCYELG